MEGRKRRPTGGLVSARVEGGGLTEEDILGFQLDRAGHALAYLMGKLGNEAIRTPYRRPRLDERQVASWLVAGSGARPERS